MSKSMDVIIDINAIIYDNEFVLQLTSKFFYYYHVNQLFPTFTLILRDQA